MSIKELLYPRFRVIGDYPFNKYFEIGDILILNEFDDREHLSAEYQNYYTLEQEKNGKGATAFYENELRRYLHLFKELFWYEERKFEDLPEFIRIKEIVYKVGKWESKVAGYSPASYDSFGANFLGIEWFYHSKQSKPITIEEYQDYNNLREGTIVYDNNKWHIEENLARIPIIGFKTSSVDIHHKSASTYKKELIDNVLHARIVNK